MELLTWIIGFSLLGGVASVVLASGILFLSDKARDFSLPHFISFAVGALLGASLVGLIPHALTHHNYIDPHDLGLTLLIGLLGFFLLEKLVLWRHCHHDRCDLHSPEQAPTESTGRRSTTSLILIGDSIHNLVDGVLITAAFMTDIHLGVVTALAIAAHEIPQELGDFVILLHNGLSAERALFYNVLSSLATVVGAVLAYFALSALQALIPYLLIIAASSFIYIAVADLIPSLHQKVKPTETLQQLFFISFGAAFIFVTHSTMH